MVKVLLTAVLALAIAAPVGMQLGAQQRAGASAAPKTSPQRAIVNVSVATLWVSPSSVRPVDAPSTTNPVNIPRWLQRMTSADRWGLVGRVQTQALYGTTVFVLQRQGSWSKVAIVGQPSQLNALGYPGWLPARRLTSNLSLLKITQSHPVAVVTSRTAWLRNPRSLVPTIRVSFATRLCVVGGTTSWDIIATPNGGTAAIAKSSVALYPSLSAILRPTGAQIVSTARTFLGPPYLWGGTSGFGFDCSGLTYTVYRRYGITVPRDADQQALYRTAIARPNLRPGDLLFFAGPGGTGYVHHVAIYVGQGLMIHSPNPSEVVKISPISSMGSEYAGARRHL